MLSGCDGEQKLLFCCFYYCFVLVNYWSAVYCLYGTPCEVLHVFSGIGPMQRPLPDNTQHSQQIYMTPVGLEPAVSADKRPQTYALNRAATGADKRQFTEWNYSDTSANEDNSLAEIFVSRNVILYKLYKYIIHFILLNWKCVHNVFTILLPNFQSLFKVSSWNGPTVHVCCFMLARASTKTFVSRIHIR